MCVYVIYRRTACTLHQGNNISSGCEERVSEGLTIGLVMKCASNPIPGLSPYNCAPFWNPLDFLLLVCYAQCCHGDGVGHVHMKPAYSVSNRYVIA